MTTCKIRILNEVDVFVGGLRGEHTKELSDLFAVRPANYRFNPRYKLGVWDGKKRYYSNDNRTKLYLLEELIPHLYKMGYKPHLEDMRKAEFDSPDPVCETSLSHVIHPYTKLPIVMYDYQVNGVNALIEHGNGIFLASTGAGKTLTCAMLVDAYGKQGYRTITVVPSGDLITQTKADYELCGLDVGEYSGNEKSYDNLHIVSTWQALQHNPTFIQQFQVVLVDEAHGARGGKLQDLLLKYAANIPFRFGVTGTLPEDPAELMDVKIALGPVRYTVTASELQDRGILSTLTIDVVQLEEDLTDQWKQFCADYPINKPPSYPEFKAGYFPDYKSEKAHLTTNTARIEWIAQCLIKAREDKKGNCLVFVDDIAFGRSIAELIPGAYFINGKDTKKIADRKVIYDMFETRSDLIVIATVHIAGTGLNIRRVFNLFLVDVGKSFIRVIQSIGRGIRKAHDKDTLFVMDVCSDLAYSKKHTAARVKHYRGAKYPYSRKTVQYVKQAKTKYVDFQ